MHLPYRLCKKQNIFLKPNLFEEPWCGKEEEEKEQAVGGELHVQFIEVATKTRPE